MLWDGDVSGMEMRKAWRCEWDEDAMGWRCRRNGDADRMEMLTGWRCSEMGMLWDGDVSGMEMQWDGDADGMEMLTGWRYSWDGDAVRWGCGRELLPGLAAHLCQAVVRGRAGAAQASGSCIWLQGWQHRCASGARDGQETMRQRFIPAAEPNGCF